MTVKCLKPLAIAALLLGWSFGTVAVAAPAADSSVEVVSPSAFRAFSEGHTLYFSADGGYFGAESYGADRQAVWQYGLGSCIRGTWRPHGAQICFTYEGGTGELCWRVFRDEAGMFARLVSVDGGESDGFELRVIRRDRRPLSCGGPLAKAAPGS
ncbi:MAG: hypothetical protein ACFBRM_11160 [Pikeienuella sp.]